MSKDPTNAPRAQRTTLADQAALLDVLVEHCPLGIVVVDAREHVQICNAAFERIFQYRRSEIEGRDLDPLIAPPGRKAEAGAFTQSSLAGKTVHVITQRRRKDGSPVEVELHSVPLFIGGKLWGAYGLYQDVTARKGAEEALEVTNRILSESVSELELRTHQMGLLSELNHFLQGCLTLHEGFAVISRSARELFPEAVSGALCIFRPSRNVVEAKSVWGENLMSEVSFSPDECWALRRGRAHWVERPDGTALCHHLTEVPRSAYCCIPMMAHGEALGVLHLVFPTPGFTPVHDAAETFKESRQRLIVTAAENMALGLATLKLRETLRDQSIRDPLTTLFNRRYLEETLERELRLAARKKRSLSFLFLDLDHFKRFNDTFGHEAGDLLLRAFADLLRQHFRGEDILCRYGGEEFAVLLPETTSDIAHARAEELLEKARRLSVSHRGQTLGPISVSIGVVAAPEHAESIADLLRLADEALYRAKATGRDRSIIAGALP